MRGFIYGLVGFLSFLTFAFALRLSTLNSPAKVTSFLILPVPDPKLFDTTMAFLALGSLPLAALFYYLGSRLQAPKNGTGVGARANGHASADSEREPLTAPTPSQSSFQVSLPVLEGYDWPGCPSSIIDKKLITGSILFGLGWGMLGICRKSTSRNLITKADYLSPAGPALLNFGTSLYSLSRGEPDPWLVNGSVWLATFVIGGLVAP